MSPIAIAGVLLCLIFVARAVFGRSSPRADTTRREPVLGAASLTIPIEGAYLRSGFLLSSERHVQRRSVLSISGESLRFRLLSESCWLFSEIESVDVRRSLFGARVVFVKRAPKEVLAVQVSGMPVARQVLAALSPKIPLTSQAATLLHGVPSEGAPGIDRYDGPTA
ncbi:hypothetical protein BH10PSE4_BH10PSE4_06250 [soil metagenome]